MNEPTQHSSLAPLTTLELGGPADWLIEAESVTEIREALRWAAGAEIPTTVLGGGSNVVVADRGVRGLVLKIANRGIEIDRGHDGTLVTAAAGEGWDELVRTTVGENLAGLECLSGIPGTAGATPIQNVGAYGREVADVLRNVRVLHRETLEERVLTPADCGFGYRTSVFRRADNPHIILEVALSLDAGGAPNLSYAQVAERFSGGGLPSLGELRAAILDLRRSKSMVIDEDDPNRRSVGSFFVNPVVDDAAFESVAASARVLGVLGFDQLPPAHEVGEDRYKLSAAWLVEHAGFPRGATRGRVGLSTKHALALIHRGQGCTEELIRFARDIRRGVRTHLGIDLKPEPVFWGFDEDDPTA
jgi:UDP-N-acetylmuramate dehydrogenase